MRPLEGDFRAAGAGAIPGGARIEREVQFDFGQMNAVRLAVRDADFTTAARIEAAINAAFGAPVSRMTDPGTVDLDLTRMRGLTPAQAIARIENIEVSPSGRARVVVDHRSGTIVLGSDVRISRIAVSQGNLTLRVTEQPIVSQPNPFSDNGETVVVPRTEADIEEEPGVGLAIVPESVTLADVVAGLNALGVGPRDMIDILQAIKAAGALHADFIVQ